MTTVLARGSGRRAPTGRADEETEPSGIAERDGDPPRAGGDPKTRRRVDWPVVGLHAALIAGMLLLAVLMWWRVWVTGHPTSTITCQCGDSSEEIWYLAWTPWAISHLHNPFLSNAIFAGQGGANMLVNTTWIAFAALFAPITWLFGPIATFNVAVTLAPVVSGWCFFLAARKVTRFVPGQVVGALLYGFSPTVVNSDPIGHFFLIWAFFPPLAFLLLYDLFVDRRHRPLPLGIGLGLLVVVQFLSGTELLAMSAVIGAAGLVCALLLAPRRAWAIRRHVAIGLGTGILTAVVLLAYPLWFALAGPRRVVGLAWPGVGGFGVNLSGIIRPGSGVTQPAALLQLSGFNGPAGPDVDYLGIALLVFLAVSVLVWFRRRVAWVLLAMGFSAWWLSLGDMVLPFNRSTNWIPMPWRALGKIPLIGQIIPGRFGALSVFAAALLLVISADAWWELGRRRLAGPAKHLPVRSRFPLRMAWAVLVSGVAAATLVPVAATYTFPYKITEGQPVPPWFVHVGPHLTNRSVLLTYPYPSSNLTHAMGWQAVDGLAFRLVGGYAIVPGRDGRHSAAISLIGGSEQVLEDLSFHIGYPPPLPTASVLSMLRRSLDRWGVNVVVITSVGRNPTYAAGFYTAMLGRPPIWQDDAWVWYGVGRKAPLQDAPAALESCMGVAVRSKPLAVPDCMMQATGAVGGPNK